MTGGTGTNTAAAYQIVDIYGLQGMGGFLTKDFQLQNSINAGGTTSWNAGAGFAPIGNNSTMYSATFNGQNFVVNNLYINQPNGNYVGLFGAVGSGGTVRISDSPTST